VTTQATGHRWKARLGALAAAAVAGALAIAAPAHAAVPDRFGYVLWDGSTVVGSGTFPGPTTVTPVGVGRFRVIFPGQAAIGGVVHVTAITGPVPHWCQVDTFGPVGPDELAQIACYRVGGTLDPTGFSASYDSSSGAPTIHGRVAGRAAGPDHARDRRQRAGHRDQRPTGPLQGGEVVLQQHRAGNHRAVLRPHR